MNQMKPEFQRIGEWRDDVGQYRGALTLPVTADGRVLLQMRDDIEGIIKPGKWCFFGGGIEGDETPQVAAQREFAEETGYEFDVGAFEPRYTVLNGGPAWGQLYVFILQFDRSVSDLKLHEGSGFGCCTQAQAEKLDLIWYIRDVLDVFWQNSN